MPSLWTLGGLSLPDLLRRTVRESWRDSVFGQGGRMAFYQFLALFPSLVVFLAVTARIPYVGQHVKDALQDLSSQVMPGQVSQLFQSLLDEFAARAPSGRQLLLVWAGAMWAAANSTWAMIYGLNRAYEVQENRSWRELSLTIAGLAVAMAVTICLAIFLIFCGASLQPQVTRGAAAVRGVEWAAVIASLSLSFSVLYRFAPSLRSHEWRWSTPGAACALLLWIGATFSARVYFDHVNNYSRSYGHLSGVAMLLLWLYASNGAILIGGEMNSEIEKAAAGDHDPARAGADRDPARRPRED